MNNNALFIILLVWAAILTIIIAALAVTVFVALHKILKAQKETTTSDCQQLPPKNKPISSHYFQLRDFVVTSNTAILDLQIQLEEFFYLRLPDHYSNGCAYCFNTEDRPLIFIPFSNHVNQRKIAQHAILNKSKKRKYTEFRRVEIFPLTETAARLSTIMLPSSDKFPSFCEEVFSRYLNIFQGYSILTAVFHAERREDDDYIPQHLHLILAK